MKNQVRNWIVGVLLLLLLPVMITLIMAGRDILALKKKMDMEVYLPMIVCGQIPWEYEDEMLKVQAVLARSSLYFHMKKDQVDEKELKKEWIRFQKDQRDKTVQDVYVRVAKAVEETKGQVITYKGKICPGVFHRVSSGCTRDGEEVFQQENMAFLSSVESEKDKCTPMYMKGHNFPKKELTRQLTARYPGSCLKEEELLSQLEILSRDSQGYVNEIQVGRQLIPGEEFRKYLKLSSGNFMIQQHGDVIRFLCKGFGHGLGLSQYGGNEMAKEGKDYKDILFYYFPKVALKTDRKEK